MTLRPTGLSIIGWLFILLGAASFIWSLFTFGFAGLGSLFGSLFTLSPQLSDQIWVSLLGMITAAVQFATGVGLLQLKRWGWYLAIIAVGLSAIQGLVGLFNGGFLSFLCAGIGLLIPLGILIYLLRGEIRALFGIGTTPS